MIRIYTAAEARALREEAVRDVRPEAMPNLLAAAPDLAASVEHHAARAERLARILAVERGDWREVPPGWEPRGADMWVRGTSPGRPVIQRWHRDGQPTEWTRRGVLDGERWPTALEAMEAIDAEVPNG